MKFLTSAFLSFILIAANSVSVFAQTQSRPVPGDDQKVRIGTTEVVLDVVVRDKKRRPVRDLTADDFEIYEDGVRQRIESFRLVLREGTARTPARGEKDLSPSGTPSAAVDFESGIGIIAMIFDRLTPEARSLARKAALSYIGEGMGKEDYAGVFGIDLSLQTIQSYTDDSQLVTQAIDRATTSSTSTFASNAAQARSLSERSAALDRAATASEADAGAAGAAQNPGAAVAAGQAIGQAQIEQALTEMNLRMLQTIETLERNHQGYATINALLAVTDSMRRLPGRKTVIFFSEGLALPPAVHTKFRSVINAANRANISIYTIDAAGLRTESGSAEAARELNALAARRLQQAHRGRDDASGPLMKSLERNEDILRLDPQKGLNQLADETGGFLISNTNDLFAGLRRIDEDRQVHYVLTYTPANQEYDGKFRHTEVKLKRPNLDVQTRKGYYAIDPLISSPVLDYEAPALAALRVSRGDNSFGLRLMGMHFPDPKRTGLTPILVEAPMSAFTFNTEMNTQTYSSDFSIVALVRDASNQVIQKSSQHYPLSGPIDKVKAARNGAVLFYREIDLPPGRYTVEAVAYDAPTSKASVCRFKLEVPVTDSSKPRMSTLVLLKRAERLTAAEQEIDHPLHFGEVVVYPNMGEPVLKSSAKQLAFFFTAWPAKGSGEKLVATIEVLQNDRSLAVTKSELPLPDEHGRIKYASALPIDGFQPGDFELKVTVNDGKTSVSRSTHFSLNK